MIIPCGAPVQLWRFFSRHNRYLYHPALTRQRRLLSAVGTARVFIFIRIHIYNIHTYILVRCYPDRIKSYRRHVSPSYIIFGCKLRLYSLVAGRAADVQHTTVSSVFMRYISTIHRTRIMCVQRFPYVSYAILWSPSADINNNKYQ